MYSKSADTTLNRKKIKRYKYFCVISFPSFFYFTLSLTIRRTVPRYTRFAMEMRSYIFFFVFFVLAVSLSRSRRFPIKFRSEREHIFSFRHCPFVCIRVNLHRQIINVLRTHFITSRSRSFKHVQSGSELIIFYSFNVFYGRSLNIIVGFRNLTNGFGV